MSDTKNVTAPILEIPKSASERIRIIAKEYRGKSYIDLRCWYADDGGQFHASSKGITLRPELVGQVVQGLLLAAKATQTR